MRSIFRAMRATPVLMLLLALGATAWAQEMPPYPAGPLQDLLWHRQEPGIALRADGVVAEGPLFVREADSKTELALPTRPDAPLTVHWSAKAEGKWVFGEVTITNRGPGQRKLELGLRLGTSLAAEEFFDGERPLAATVAQSNERFAGRFPLTTLSSPSACLAVGYLPDQWLSYLRHSFTPGEATSTLETATRIVVDTGESETVNLLAGFFTTRWGYREALHWYYETFPGFFSPRPGVDPRASLNGGSYLAWTTSPKPDLCRRMQVGWEWCYAPFKRTGDVYGRPELWDYTPARPHSGDRLLPIDQYHKVRKARFDAGKACDVGMMCYIPSQIWCEEQLANSRYQDALITDSRVTIRFDKPWVTGPDNEVRVFPYLTSFGKQSLLDMKAMVEENNLQGFAFDTANGGAKYFGPAVNQCPGRAWDDRGVYVDEGVAIAKLMDWCHENKEAEGRPLSVVSNPGGLPCYLTPLRSDSAMLEADPMTVDGWTAQCLRNFLGHKTMVFWETYELEEMLNYEGMTAAQMEDALRGLEDYTILACLQVASVPTPRICLGHRKLVRWLPLLMEIAQTGWQPVPAATCDGPFVMSRAGKGRRQFLMTGNRTAEAKVATIDADNSWFGAGAMLFAREGTDEPTTNEVRGGQTRVTAEIASRDALVLRSALQLNPAPEGLRASVSVNQGLAQTQLRIALQSATTVQVTAALPDWGRFSPTGLKIDGQVFRLVWDKEGWKTERPVTLTGAQECLVTLRSNCFAVDQAAVDSFPWVDLPGKACGFAIEAAVADPQVAYAAQRLADYFPYYYSAAVQPAVTLAPPQVSEKSATTKPRVALRVDPGLSQACQIRADAAGLVITGRTGADVKQGVYNLLAVLDKRYEYAGGLTGTAAIKATGLAGKDIQ